ncbi:hypothetical protein [Limnobacter parvus]|uniref:MSHA biogenesis protein MshI n=1 Tax=Limnobacter parvus TaxID=2939690 RepID=A0ABT1XF97_9BURK|nr:hypothetical protein [Limnobacter parvus]MCR2745946.1 hypothetical protein [Limnobacter parvus]
MKSIRTWLAGLSRGSAHALSFSFSARRYRWVYGEIDSRGCLSFRSILGSGGGALGVTASDDAFVSGESLKQAIAGALGQLSTHTVRPQFVVMSVPSKHAYLGEISVEKNERENLIRYQIQELMEAAAGESEREAAFDWQVKAELSDGSVNLAVAGIDQRQVDEILEACQQFNLGCLGITLDSVAAMNGYLQMASETLRAADIQFLLHGELSRHRVRLAVFSQGVLFNESWEHSEDGFSVVQAISALERLVSTWTRDGAPEEVASVRLILGGELMYAKGCESTAKRSQILSPRLLDITPRRELATHWHDDVVPFGALEAMPCE